MITYRRLGCGYGWETTDGLPGFSGYEMHRLLHGSPQAVISRKLGKTQPVSDELRRERAYNDLAAICFKRTTGYPVAHCNSVITNTDFPFMLADITHCIDGGVAGIECRRFTEFTPAGGIPPPCFTQCLQNLAVTGGRLWYFAAYVSMKEFHIYAISRDASFIAPEWCCSCAYVTDDNIERLRETAALYWRYVERGEVPPPFCNTGRNGNV